MTTEGTLEKAARLYTDGRVVFMPAKYVARVTGDTGTYTVTAHLDSVECNCPAFRNGIRCSHVLAAMLAWQAEQEHAS